ncbi:MAG: hypothetical protein ACLFS1_11350 [Opitutales bacterium]
MAEDPKDTPAKSSEKLDLASLSGLDFGPNWADQNKSDHGASQSGGKGASAGKGSKGPQRGAPRDRRGPTRKDAGPQKSKSGRFDRRRDGRTERADFQPTVKIDLYPQDEAFDALVKRLQSSARTYQLFDIARLLLEKSERFVVVVTPKPKKDEKEPGLLHYSIPGHLPFETESEAIHFVLNNHLDLFFETEEFETEPPKGNFQMVHRCGITGELLGPPNYHRYQEFLKRHFASRISGMSFEKFQARLKSSKEQEDIDAWLDSMRKRVRYILKDRSADEPESFDTFEAARHFLLQHRKDKLVDSSESVRFAGRDLERMPHHDIRRSVETYVEQQRQFPLDTANNIRGRLRRHNFAVYKKGSKGASFVCAVKRKFRDESTSFTESISDLIDFIEKHPNTPASKLPKLYIGIDTEKQKPEALKMTDEQVRQAEKEAREKADAEAADSEAKPAGAAATDPGPGEREQIPATQEPNPAPVEQSPDSEKKDSANADKTAGDREEVSDSAPAGQPAVASTDAQPKSVLTEAEQAKLRQLMLDLRWLITEGYVTEYGDGTLFTPPPIPSPKKEDEPNKAAAEAAAPAPKPHGPDQPQQPEAPTPDQPDTAPRPADKDKDAG